MGDRRLAEGEAPHVCRRWTVLSALVLILLCGAVSQAARAEAEVYFMSCGFPPVYAYGVYSGGDITYRKHPKNCFYSQNGSTLSTVVLRKIRWRSWGGRKTWAIARRVDLHDQEGNGFQSHRVRVVLRRPKAAIGSSGRVRLFYTRLLIHDPTIGGSPQAWRLFRPGQDPVSFHRSPSLLQ